MKKIIAIIIFSIVLSSCSQGNGEIALRNSVGRANKVLVVIKNSLWMEEVGDELRVSLGKLMVGMPQPEKTLSLAQVAPLGFKGMMRNSRNILLVEQSDKEVFNINTDKYARPQTLIYLSGTSEESIKAMIAKHADEIKKTFKSSDVKIQQEYFATKKVDDSKYKTLQNLKISLTIPKEFRTVDDTGEFLWLRQHLRSGIARGAGSNNILVYSIPLKSDFMNVDSVIAMRDKIGERYIPGSKDGMYMITEKLYDPKTNETSLKGLKTYETRGKWEMKNDFMAGPFLNYAIIDKKNNRILVIEGFTYAPSVDKRQFIFELEAIAKSVELQ